MSDNIPLEIQAEIIKRTPVKSIVRFRSVSKTWRSLIDSPEFISGYGTRKTHPRSLLVRYKEKFADWKYVSVNDEEDTFTQQQDLTPNVSALMKQLGGLFIIGCSRGLLCLYSINKEMGKGGMLVLWNPSIRRSVGIRGSAYLYNIFGFVVCPVTNEPTIVKLVYPWIAEIFTLSSKKWTVIQCLKPPRECQSVSLYGQSQVVIDGCIYRVAYESIRLQNGSYTAQFMIVSFDLNVKQFKAIDLPDTITSPVTSQPRFIIAKLKGSLVVIVPRSEIREIKVWKMESDCSFTQLFTINTLHSWTIWNILGFRKNGGLVVETQETPGEWASASETAIEAYDPCSKQITNLGLSGLICTFFISSFKETLHLLDHSDSCEYPEIS